MAEEIIIKVTDKKTEKYRSLLPQIEALVKNEPNMTANMANMTAALKEAFNFFWIGFYFVDDNTLVLGPFQGPIACTRIGLGKGVCGTAWADKQTVMVPNVDDFSGHIACNSNSKSEIVLPGIDANGQVIFVLDVDSDKLNDFDEIDKLYLEKLVGLLT